MGYVRGEAPGQSSLFPARLDELVPQDHLVRVIEAFVASLNLVELGFERAQPGPMGRPGFDPADLLKLYVYGYLNRVRSSRRLERECQRNVEVMWLLGRLAPDHKTLSEFRRRNGAAFVRVCRAFIGFCREAQLIGGELVAIDGSKFQAVSSRTKVVSRKALAEENRRLEARIEQYLQSLDESDRQEQAEPIDPAAVRGALQRLRERQADCQSAIAALDELKQSQHVRGESEAKLMRTAHGHAVAYNVQSAVDAKHGLIVHHEVTSEATDNNQLEPVAKAAKESLGVSELQVVADAGYSNGTQFAACEQAGITPFVPPNRAPLRNESAFYTADRFAYDPSTDTYRCPADKILALKQINRPENARIYAASEQDCSGCAHKAHCTGASRRFLNRHWHEDAFKRMVQRLAQAPDMMKRRAALAEHPFAQLKLGVLGDARLLLRGLRGARTEIALAVVARNLRRVMNILGTKALIEQLNLG
jgi:transposase